MSKTNKASATPDAKKAKQERLERALRENLKRRKQAAGPPKAADD